MVKKTLEFFDLKTKKKFRTNKWTKTTLSNGRLAAKAKAPSGITVFRFLKKGS